MNHVARLILIRHGETEWNVAHRMQGQADSPLTARGRDQALGLGRRLGKLGVQALYSSDLGRAVATCQPITQATGLEPFLEPRLRERAFGVFEGLSWPEIYARHQMDHHDYVYQSEDWAMPGGESQRQVFDRTLRVLTEIAARHEDQTVAIVAHGGNLAAGFRIATGLSPSMPRRYSLLNAALNVIERRDDEWHLVSWGDVAHCE